jgi:hypothetical protein
MADTWDTEIKRPLGMHPWSTFGGTEDNGAVWISMKPKKILDQFSKAQGDIATERLQEEFKFLAPLTLNENIVHHWEAYESVASRLAQKMRSLVKLGSEGAALVGVYENAANIADNIKNTFKQRGGSAGKAIENIVGDVYSGIPGSRIPKIKIDTPLYYANSDRRQIIFEFNLFHENIPNSSPEDVLVKPIKKLMKYSSPDLKSDINIEFPFMWEIKTVPVPFINYTTCALVGVQPTWNSPYVDHVPSSVNLQLTFLDMSPLYRETIKEGSVINIISKEESDRRKNTNQLQSIKSAKNQYEPKKAGQAQPLVLRFKGRGR